jgi:hypothetical protein
MDYTNWYVKNRIDVISEFTSNDEYFMHTQELISYDDWEEILIRVDVKKLHSQEEVTATFSISEWEIAKKEISRRRNIRKRINEDKRKLNKFASSSFLLYHKFYPPIKSIVKLLLLL